MAICDSVADAAGTEFPLARQQSRFIAARCLWMSEDAKDRQQAKKLFDELAKQSADTQPGQVLVALIHALILEDSNLPEAIHTLQVAVAKQVPDAVTVEAQIELARLLSLNNQGAGGEDAKAQLDLAERFINEQLKREKEYGQCDGYLAGIAATRQGIKLDENPGLAELETADVLYRDGKFAEAAKAYELVFRKYPTAQSGERAQLGLGHALVKLGRAKDAATVWQKLIAGKPAGRWRGQAFAGMLDLYLIPESPISNPKSQASDLNKLTDLAEASMSMALADKEAVESWKQAELDLHLRLGIVRWVNGKGEKAAEHLEQAKRLSTGDAQKALEALIPIVKANQPILPEGVAKPDRQTSADAASLTLSLGVVYGISGQYEQANECVRLIEEGRLSATPAQTAFAEFLQIALDEASGKVERAVLGRADGVEPTPKQPNKASRTRKHAKDGTPARDEAKGETLESRYRRLTQQHPKEPWLDEVIYRLAAMRDVTAASATNSTALDSHVREEPVFDSKVEANVQDCYREIIEKCPNSARRERSMWRLGRLLLDGGNGEEADKLYQRQLKDYPQGPYAGDALVRMIDTALEYRFDLKQAKDLTDGGVKWVANGAEKQATQDSVTLEPWRGRDNISGQAVRRPF